MKAFIHFLITEVCLKLCQATGHEIPEALLDEVMNVSRAFFCLPIEEKQKYTNLIDGKEFKLEGYGNDRVASDDQILDWSDRLYLLVQPEGQRNLALWPETPASFRYCFHYLNQGLRAIGTPRHGPSFICWHSRYMPTMLDRASGVGFSVYVI